MKKVAVVFVLAVFVPSLLLAWLAIRSLRDQQTVVERQRSLLYQGVADALAKSVRDFLAGRQRDFAQQVETMLIDRSTRDIAGRFDEQLRRVWPLAEVGFAVLLDGNVLSPSLPGRPEVCRFRLENDCFFCCEAVEVYWNSPRGPVHLSRFESDPIDSGAKESDRKADSGVFPPKSRPTAALKLTDEGTGTKPAPREAEFRQLIGDSYEGTLARFLQNKLELLIWCRSKRDPQLVFGAQLDLKRIIADLSESVHVPNSLQAEITAALLDDNAKPVAGRRPERRQPFVTSEIGEGFPHWLLAIYLQDPAQIPRSAQTLRLTLTLLISLLMLAIGVGGGLVVANVKRQLALARQKTDFVGNVSHELKTPLTSIRMFSELLAEDGADAGPRQRRFLRIITAETARLTRLINNVLDFARLERGEQNYHFTDCDLKAVLNESLGAYRPHLESKGFSVRCELPDEPVMVNGDRDALAQVMVNLISNAEKYSAERKEILLLLKNQGKAELQVLDRGVGVPSGCEEKIFEQFYRAHDSLASGVQGSGLGLTLARQIARAHGGNVTYEPRKGGGSCFILRLPITKESLLRTNLKGAPTAEAHR